MSSPATIHREIADAWNRRDFNAIRNLLHPGYSFTGGDGQERTGPDVAMEVANMYTNAFPNGRLEVRRVYTDGNTAVAEMIGTGTHDGSLLGVAPTGKQVAIVICNIIEMRDGKVYREREYLDMLELMTQIGAAPAPGRAAGA